MVIKKGELTFIDTDNQSYVYLPHQCDEWIFSGYYQGKDRNEKVIKDLKEWVKDLTQLIVEIEHANTSIDMAEKSVG